MRRRRFLTLTAAGGAFAGIGDLAFLARLPAVHDEQAALDPAVVRLHPDIEPLVRLLEETPRDRLLEEVGLRIRRGLTYREVLAALLLAGVRTIQPQPVGFQFHAVLVVNSAHLASLASPESDRWLPIFWALDQFKVSQAADVRQGDWTLGPVRESAVPPREKARQAFVDAMDRWDEGAADGAIAGVARTAAREEIVEPPRAVRGARFPRHRPQGDLRRQQRADARRDRLAARRAGVALAGARAALSRGRERESSRGATSRRTARIVTIARR